MTIAQTIREQRRAARLTRRRLSELSGVESSFIRKIESGNRNPTIETLQKLARGFRSAEMPFHPEVERFLDVA